MSYDKEYSKQYYLKNKERINKRARAWQRTNADKHRISWQNWRKNHKEKDNENWRKRYQKRKEAFEKKYGVFMGRNIQNERVRKYLANPEYYKEQLKGKVTDEHLSIASYYLDDPSHTLFLTGREFYKSKERIRQIVAKFLFKVWKTKEEENMIEHTRVINGKVVKIGGSDSKEEIMEEKNDKPFEKQEKLLAPGKIPFTLENYTEIKDLLYQGESVSEIRKKTGRAASLIGAVRSSENYENYYIIRREDAHKHYKNKVGKTKKTPLPAPLVERLVDEESGVEVTFHGVLPDSPSPHRQALADAIDAFVKIEVEIRVKEKLRRLLEET